MLALDAYRVDVDVKYFRECVDLKSCRKYIDFFKEVLCVGSLRLDLDAEYIKEESRFCIFQESSVRAGPA